MARVETFPQQRATTAKPRVKRLGEERARAERETAGLEDIAALVRPVIESGEASKIGDALKLLADRGDRRAAAYLAQLTGPESREFSRLMDLAVASDPYWTKLPDRRGYSCRKGAVHDTPEKLVAAYKARRGLD